MIETIHENNLPDKMTGSYEAKGLINIIGNRFIDNTDGTLREIYIFNVESIESEQALCSSDPAIVEGILEMELKEWYGSAALMGIPDRHKKLERKNVA